MVTSKLIHFKANFLKDIEDKREGLQDMLWGQEMDPHSAEYGAG
jgi:hypothetical protein